MDTVGKTRVQSRTARGLQAANTPRSSTRARQTRVMPESATQIPGNNPASSVIGQIRTALTAPVSLHSAQEPASASPWYAQPGAAAKKPVDHTPWRMFRDVDVNPNNAPLRLR